MEWPHGVAQIEGSELMGEQVYIRPVNVERKCSQCCWRVWYLYAGAGSTYSLNLLMEQAEAKWVDMINAAFAFAESKH